MPARQLDHPLAGDMQMAIDPGVALIQPIPVVALPSPRGSGRARDLVRRVPVQVITGRSRLDYLLVVVELAEEIAEEGWALVPPVAEQLRVVWADHDRRPVHAARKPLDLALSRHAEMRSVLAGPPARNVGVVHPLVVQLVVGDRVILDARVRPVAFRVDVGADIVERQIEADVAVEIAIVAVARIAFARAPHLL